jgi:hypothetical protein
MDFNQLMQTMWYRDPISIATIVIAAATVVYVAVSYYLLKATKRTAELTQNIFEAANRPYLGILSGAIQLEQGGLRLQTNIKNFGTAVAIDIESSWSAVINGKELPSLDTSKTFAVLPPQSEMGLITLLNPEEYLQLDSTGTTMELAFSLTYKSLAQKEYYYRERQVFERQAQGFIKVAAEAS